MNRGYTTPIESKEPREVVEQRFWSKVDKNGPNGCWLWTGAQCWQGYGRMAINDGTKIRAKVATRVSWVLAHGEIPANQFVLHRCDNPPCVNPAHLFLGRDRENMRDCAGKGRAANQHGGSKLTPEMVRQLRGYLNDGTLTAAELAALYGVSKSTVQMAHRRHTWAHVD